MLRKPLLSGLFLIHLTLIFGCGGPGANNASERQQAANANANAPRTNIEELGMHVKIPFEAEDVVWKEDASRRTILAVLRFSPGDSDKLVAGAGAAGQPATIEPETWFPDELIAQGEAMGDNVLKGTSYPATSFLQEPYTSGKITRIESTDYFVLEASASRK